MLSPPNKKSGQTVVSTVSRFQPVASALIRTFGHNGPLGGKFGQVLPGARRLQPDSLGDLAAGGLGRVGQVLQNLRFALLGNTPGLIAAFYRHFFIADFYRRFFRNQRQQQRGAVGAETLGDLRRFPALFLPDSANAGQARCLRARPR